MGAVSLPAVDPAAVAGLPVPGAGPAGAESADPFAELLAALLGQGGKEPGEISAVNDGPAQAPLAVTPPVKKQADALEDSLAALVSPPAALPAPPVAALITQLSNTPPTEAGPAAAPGGAEPVAPLPSPAPAPAAPAPADGPGAAPVGAMPVEAVVATDPVVADLVPATTVLPGGGPRPVMDPRLGYQPVPAAAPASPPPAASVDIEAKRAPAAPMGASRGADAPGGGKSHTEAGPPLAAVAPAPSPLAGSGPSHSSSVVRSAGNAHPSATTAPVHLEARLATPAPSAEAPLADDQEQDSAPAAVAVVSPPGLKAAAAEAPAVANSSPAPADAPPAVHEVAHVVVERAEQGGGEARLRLDPPELGRVEVHVRVHDGGVNVEVHAERPEVARLLQDHHRDLTALLTQRGLDLAGLNVGVGYGQAHDRHDARQFMGPGQPRAQSGDFAAILGIAPESPIDTHNRLRAAYNPDGSHVYRI